LDPLILYDGVCRLCGWSVNIILKADRRGRLKFAALQSDPARSLLEAHGLKPDTMTSMIFVEGGRVSMKSTALLRIARHLGGAWHLCRIGWLVPRVVRDVLYDVIARNRYSWFGKNDTCPPPDPKYNDRFLL